MRKHSALCSASLLAAALLLHSGAQPSRASDHADPMSLNVLKVQQSPEANITDLHAFIVDRAGKLVTEGDPSVTGDQLIVSLCVRRALRPDLVGGLQLKGFKFRVHLDMAAPVRIFDEAKSRENYEKQLAQRDELIATKTKALDEAKAREKEVASAENTAQAVAADKELKAAVADRGALVAARESDRSMQALYGGVITQPDAIAETALLEFELDLVEDGEQSQAVVVNHRFEGIAGARNVVTREKKVGGVVKIQEHAFQPGEINIEAGVFDDPVIFPRFFRRNVVAIVTSIPLANLMRPAGGGPILLWATTHDKKGKVIDHVGRSLRTQLPRFGYLNELTPAEHVKAVTRVHERPSVMDDLFATFVSPLFAHRHYDSVPDVMVYDLHKPAHFPNGRALTDDVGGILAEAGETLLLELSYAESKQFPRATTNDKEFSPTFPYLAPRWTASEVAAYAAAGTSMGGFAVPRAPEGAAIAMPNFKDSSWRTLWLVEVVALILFTLLLLFTVRSKFVRWVLVAVAVVALCMLHFVYAANLPPMNPHALAQPARKLCRLICEGLLIGALGLGWVFALGRRSGAKVHPPEPFPLGNQELTEEEQRAAPDSYDEVKRAVFSEPYYGDAWGAPERRALPNYRQTLGSLLRGLFPLGKRLFLQAAERTVRSRADLRWGADRKGFRRLLHPMGICLTGSWRITAAPEGAAYTGYFAKGAEGRIIGRYSTGGSEARGGHYRSLALVGKIYPKAGPGPQPPDAPAHFFTQEDLGANFTNSIREAMLTNSPPVSPWNRGKEVFFLLVNGLTLLLADDKNSERQLYEIAELGKREGPTSCPRFMRLSVSEDTPKNPEDGADFREEILGILYDRGSSKPTGRKLIFNIEVSDEGKKWGRGIEWLTGQHWTRIGQIVFDEAAASYNGDFVIHFHHPVWRTDRNVPASIARAELRP